MTAKVVYVARPMDPDRARSMARLRSKLPHLIRGFVIESDDGARELVCVDVRGFRDALVAAHDRSAPAPQRFALVVPDDDMSDWLASWSQDCERTRRVLVVRRLFDGAAVAVVATLASYGSGVETSLSLESIRAASVMPQHLVRSGVHPKVVVERLS